MLEAMSILSVGIGTLLAIVVFAVIVFWFIEDVTQKKHAVLRNYPVIGRLRVHLRPQGAGGDPLRERALPGPGMGEAADSAAHDRRRLLHPSLRGALDRERERHELRRHLEAGGAGALTRRRRRWLLARHG